jgi:hypothetical protein
MKNYVYYSNKGKILKISNQSPIGIIAGEDKAIEVDFEVDISNSYVKDEAIVALPIKPSAYYTFNYDTMLWEDTRTTFEILMEVKRIRDTLLASSDWTQLPDNPLSIEKREEWAYYRQLLRDITEQQDLNNIIWPTAPQS